MSGRSYSLRRLLLSNGALTAATVLFAVLAGVAVLLGPSLRTRSAIAHIESLGGEVYILPGEHRWLVESLGLDPRLSAVVTAIDLSNVSVTDDDVAAVAALPRVQTVHIYGNRISAAGLSPVFAIPELRTLTLIDCRGISGAELRTLRRSRPAVDVQLRGPALLGIGAMSHPEGCEIAVLKPGSAADAVGMQVGDVIVKFGEHRISDFKALTRLVAMHEPGDRVPVQWLRQNQPVEQTVELGGWK